MENTVSVFAVSFSLALSGAYALWSLVAGFIAWRREKARRADFEGSLLDLVTALVDALRAGMAFQQALERVAPRMQGAMREEIAAVLRECRLGLDFAAAIDRLAARMPIEDMRLVSSAVRLTAQTGGSLADVLSEMAETLRARREFRDRLLSLTAQGRFEGAALALMPAVAFAIFYAIQPSMMSLMFTTRTGWIMTAVALSLEAIGYLLVKRISTVEV